MISLFTLFVLAFALFVIVKALVRLKNRELTALQALFWIVSWIVVISIVLVPDVSTIIAHLFGVGRGVDLFVYAAVILLFYLIFQLNTKIDHTNHEVTRLVRSTAIYHGKKPGKRL